MRAQDSSYSFRAAGVVLGEKAICARPRRKRGRSSPWLPRRSNSRPHSHGGKVMRSILARGCHGLLAVVLSLVAAAGSVAGVEAASDPTRWTRRGAPAAQSMDFLPALAPRTRRSLADAAQDNGLAAWQRD